jgi:Polyketide cyclase / dehydrase and lipid transport
VQPVTVKATVSKPIEAVYEFLEVLGNHESFVDHLFTDWSFSGPARGVGARARARTNAPASQDWTEFEVVEAEAPSLIVEEAVGANGRRRTRGAYELAREGDGRTEVRFELAWIEEARLERLFAPLTRAFVRRANAKSLRRLVRLLEVRESAR